MIATLELPLPEGRHIGDILALESVPINDLIELGWRAAFWMHVENDDEWGRYTALNLMGWESLQVDPNATLMKIRAALSVMNTTEDFEAWTTAAADLQEQVGALDEWLSQGNFPPEDWRTRIPTEGELRK